PDETFERCKPVVVVGRPGVWVASRLRALDLLGQSRRPFGPRKEPARVQRERHRKSLCFPRLAEDRACVVCGYTRHRARSMARGSGVDGIRHAESWIIVEFSEMAVRSFPLDVPLAPWERG